LKILRFDISSRVLHWSHALVFSWLLITGINIFFTPKSLLSDPFIRMLHLYASLPFIILPLLIYLLGSISTRNDIKELMEWTDDDIQWFLKLLNRNKREITGKFNAGQKANFLMVLVLIIGLSLTGFVIWMKAMFSRDFVELNFIIHDSLAIFSILIVAGHITLAFYYRESMEGIISGKVDSAWAKEKDKYSKITNH